MPHHLLVSSLLRTASLVHCCLPCSWVTSPSLALLCLKLSPALLFPTVKPHHSNCYPQCSAPEYSSLSLKKVSKFFLRVSAVHGDDWSWNVEKADSEESGKRRVCEAFPHLLWSLLLLVLFSLPQQRPSSVFRCFRPIFSPRHCPLWFEHRAPWLSFMWCVETSRLHPASLSVRTSKWMEIFANPLPRRHTPWIIGHLKSNT